MVANIRVLIQFAALQTLLAGRVAVRLVRTGEGISLEGIGEFYHRYR
jgi:hypothetical protein